MAMAKEIKEASGVMPKYWRIRNLHVYCNPDKTVTGIIELDGYLDDMARIDGNAPASSRQVNINFGTVEPSREAAYNILSEMDGEFKGAQTV